MSDAPEVTATRTLVVGGRPTRQVRTYTLSVDGGTTHEVREPRCRIGSREGNDVVIDDESVSRAHLEIVADEHGFRVRDLDSSNGTFLDGARVRDAYLRPGSVLRIGRSTLRFVPAEEEVAIPATGADSFGAMRGRSLVMREVFALLARAAPTPVTVLIEGETGTGKELCARAIHDASPRAEGPFVVFDCGAVPETLIESELFGHVRGSFTSASTSRAGAFERADGGTLFLDELGELPLDLQPKLLRVLEAREVRRLGANDAKKVDVRIVAATNRELAREVNRGAFRDDLYFRIAVLEVRLPPLRERREDLRLLVDAFVRETLEDRPARADAVFAAIDDDTWDRLRRHPWKGNVRELKNVVLRTLILAGDDERPSIDLADPVGAATGATAPAAVDLDRPFVELKQEMLAHFETAYLTAQLERHGGNLSAAARASGLDRMYFKRLLKKRS